MKKQARLVLENGVVFHGAAFGATGKDRTGGEVVFTTSITGYQEILTDPSYAGQIVTMTNPLIGNYGANNDDLESRKPFVSGFIIRELAEEYSNWRSTESISSFLSENNILAIEGIDTRKLVRILRSQGALRGIVTTESVSDKAILDEVQKLPIMTGLDLTKGVTTSEAYEIAGTLANAPHVVVIDYGIKQNILRKLTAHGAKLTVMPSTVTYDEIKDRKPDGIFLSNGPGDPEAVTDGIETVKHLVEGKKYPIFGICLGNQLLSLALGGETYKLKFGHRGANHPVKNLETGKIEITSQNHGFCVNWDTMPDSCELTHLNLNDNTVEGFRHKELPIFAVQYHPEASPGPHESDYLFTQFMQTLA
ncbi:MAG: glutamine-hydrolyzing carbamoyl-phosphate synthase small subunit [Bacteroidota bacterium]|nr:glutamine-hydrolyzing carbamoyl-phosphate synthase small subunit [Bacteroidota bacterium]MDP4231188.1 glutamine-hydrolyzing carbamoyl-phosphate synthase small subunit [Bacteroidota bacterium]MDP4235568.1 glutamine-hydrolyzing carbamoyl-phosphate synthase small subunit [Bacteroidota bacterium]